MVDNCSYACDSVICCGVSQSIIDIAKAEVDQDLTVMACEALNHIYGGPNKIDPATLEEGAPLIIDLLQLSNTSAVRIVLSTLTSIAAQHASIVYLYFEHGVYSAVPQLLTVREVCPEALRLAGVLAMGKRSHTRAMLDAGLLPLLVELLGDDSLGADSLAALSSLAEYCAPSVLPSLDPSFFAGVVEGASDGSFEVKKESAFFLATVATTAPAADAAALASAGVAAVLVEIVNCGEDDVVGRSIDAIQRLINVAGPESEFAAAVAESEIGEYLSDAAASESIRPKAIALESILESLRGG